MCEEWLRAHGISCTGTVSELRDVIRIKKNDLESTIKLKVENICPVIVLDAFIGSLLSTISSTMTTEINEDTVSEIDREVKIYLTNLHIVQKHINDIHEPNGNEDNIFWLKKYNFLSLLNIPDAINKYGPLINLWEGFNQGEGYLRYAKPKVVNIHSKNWQINARISLLNETSMNNVINCHALNKNSNDMKGEYVKHVIKKKRTVKKMFHTYKSINEVFSLYRRNRPLSAMKCNNSQFFIAVNTGKKDDLK